MENRSRIHIPDVPVQDTWDRLKAVPAAILVDVRTRAEWTYTGIPDLGALGRDVLLVEVQTFPDGQTNTDFVQQVAAALPAGGGAGGEAELFFICRSGARSRKAAEMMAAAGYRKVANVADGFEGPLDAEQHRGRIAGWKAAGLPWKQG